MIVKRVVTLWAGSLLAVAACTGAPDGSRSPALATSTATGTPSRDSTWAALPTAGPPVVPYVRGQRYVTPQGRDSVLPPGRRGVSGVVVFSDGLLVSDTAYFEGTNGLALVRQGVRVGSWPSAGRCSSGTPIASADGRYVAWVTVRCPESLDRSISAVHRARADGSAEVTRPVGPGVARVIGFLGRRVVYNAGFEDGAWITDLRHQPRRLPRVDRVGALSQRTGWFVGQRGDHAQLVVDADGAVRWRLRAGDLSTFSPDGTKVLAVRAGRQVTVLHARAGAAAAAVDLPAGADVAATVWETNRTLLTLLRQGGRIAIVRLRLDGRVERVTPALRLRNGRSPYVLLPHP